MKKIILDIDTTDHGLLIFLAYVVIFLIAVLIVRAIFSIPTIVRCQIAQVRLQAIIAESYFIEKEKIHYKVTDRIDNILSEAKLTESRNKDRPNIFVKENDNNLDINIFNK